MIMIWYTACISRKQAISKTPKSPTHRHKGTRRTQQLNQVQVEREERHAVQSSAWLSHTAQRQCVQPSCAAECMSVLFVLGPTTSYHSQIVNARRTILAEHILCLVLVLVMRYKSNTLLFGVTSPVMVRE